MALEAKWSNNLARGHKKDPERTGFAYKLHNYVTINFSSVQIVANRAIKHTQFHQDHQCCPSLPPMYGREEMKKKELRREIPSDEDMLDVLLVL
jgi:hypothetical protein